MFLFVIIPGVGAGGGGPPYPPPSCESNTKIANLDGNNTSWCSDKGAVCAHREKTQHVTIAL